MKDIKMTKAEAKREHKRLIWILEKGTLAQRVKEAKKQKEEMKKYNIEI